MSKASDTMGKVKARLVLEEAFFASIICALPLIEDATLNPPTMATNAKWVKYHPQFVEDCTFDELTFVLCHEVGHCIMEHCFRRGSRDPKKWNQAGDYCINELLTTCNKGKGIGAMPAGGLQNTALFNAGGGTTDGVYNLLPDAQDDGSGGQSNGHGDPMDDCQDQAGSEAEKAEAQAEMKVMVAQAAQAAKMCGQMTAELERLVDGCLKPKVDWKDVLRRFVAERSKVERSWARPNRRFLGEGLYLPSLQGQAMGEILVAIDTSGSITDAELGSFFAELQGIKADTNPKVIHVVYFHSRVCHYDRFEQDDELELSKTESGGTAFSPIFRYADSEAIEPICAVVLTDLECNDFGPAPSYPVLWCSTHASKAEFGEVVMIDPGQP